MYELNKREKKIAREVIEKGVQAEFKAGLEKAKKVIAQWDIIPPSPPSPSFSALEVYHPSLQF